MKSKARWMVALAVMAGVCWNGAMNSMANDYEAQLKAAAAARAKDPAWKPSCQEVDLIQIGDKKKPGTLRNFCLNAEGNILACFGKAIRVYSPKGELLKTLPLEIQAGAICVAKDGSIFAAGDGRVLKLNADGKVLASAVSPVASEPVTITKEIEEMLKQSGRPIKEERERMLTSLEKRRTDVAGLAATEQDVFMAVGAPSDFTYRVYRFNHALENPKLVVEKLRGCCGQMNIQSHADNLWIPHNARHQVESRDRDGKELAKFGKAGRVKPSDFGGCCEPKCMRVLPNGEILAAESGPPTCIKRFSATGKFIEVIAAVETKGDCVRVTVEMSPDGKRYYLLDTTRDAIRVFAAKG
ncbi:MAG: hypothetical protein IH623_14475 [Verrucomicrobia bacterium]|nr:hypothetical protein [Verrucomicrobiota bacterium]